MLDTVLLAKQGIRTGLICTDPFANTAATIAETHGAQGYPFAVLPHPAASLPDGPRRERAREAAQQLIRILSEESVQILAEENG
jgi:hypothetical protein